MTVRQQPAWRAERPWLAKVLDVPQAMGTLAGRLSCWATSPYSRPCPACWPGLKQDEREQASCLILRNT